MRIFSRTLIASMLSFPAYATTYTISASPQETDDDVTGWISYTGNPNLNEHVFIGPTNVTVSSPDSNTNMLVWCTDIFNNFVSGTTYNETTGLSLETRFGAIKANQIAAILSNATESDTDHDAAIQAAIWAVIYEPGTLGYSLSSNTFSITFDNDSNIINAIAATYLNGINTTSWWGSFSNLNEFDSINGSSQDFDFLNPIYATSTNIPEPSSFTLFGLGIIGLIIRKIL